MVGPWAETSIEVNETQSAKWETGTNALSSTSEMVTDDISQPAAPEPLWGKTSSLRPVRGASGLAADG
jgi:hypothetical protein